MRSTRCKMRRIINCMGAGRPKQASAPPTLAVCCGSPEKADAGQGGEDLCECDIHTAKPASFGPTGPSDQNRQAIPRLTTLTWVL